MSTPYDILIVEDEPLVRMNYVDILEDAGFNVFTASSLAQGLREVGVRQFHVIVCDNDLGDGKGFQLVGHLEASGINCPVIYLSAAQQSVLDHVAGMSLVRKVLLKPVDGASLAVAVRELAGQSPSQAHDSRFPATICDEERESLLDIFNHGSQE